MSRHERLDEIELFASLPADAQGRVEACARRERFKPGDAVTSEGAVSYYFFTIASGTADVRLGGEVVAQLGPGDFFGEMGALPHEAPRWTRRSATVEATSKLSVVAIADHELRELIDEFPQLGERLRTAAEERARSNREHVAGTPG
jgi:CRP-like cAMP-binding protein